MKKILFTLAALALPFTASAKAEHTLPQSTINASIKRFTPAYCKMESMAWPRLWINVLKKQASEVQ
ncbi:hypothetical protein [Commensalibacter nepenthis]|uniref:Uncharacterized protein n=1 Tax=Commensalibacter nepenthis TaxID=3043872 RepID=A0ABT6Q5J0_9PROT|nr:hypothetical protein [Commensalibacter sp. TBRC 10068]MDI2112166.1 hypothetical protein [Commensalibacter sp. TBRC 10068]